MYVLGLHIGVAYRQNSESYLHHSYRDSSAALVAPDGSSVVAVEGRLSGIWGTPAFPAKSIRACLTAKGVDWPSVSMIVLDLSEGELDRNVLQQRLQDPRQIVSTGRQWLAALFESELGIDVADRFHFCEHTLAHANHSLCVSAPDNALCLCIDGSGNMCTGMVAQITNGQKINVLNQFSAKQSLMKLYRVVNGLLGLDAADIFSTMAVASRGDPAHFWPHFETMHRLSAEGSFSLASESEMLESLDRAGLTRLARRGAAAFSQVHLDIVASAQLVLRRIVGHVLKYHQAQTKADTLCLCGSIAANTEICGRVLYARIFNKIVVPTARDDLDNALGAALSVIEVQRADNVGSVAYLSGEGSLFAASETARSIRPWTEFVEIERLEHGMAAVASLIAKGEIVGWVQNEGQHNGYRPVELLLGDPSAASTVERLASILRTEEWLLRRIALVPEERISEFIHLPPSTTASPLVAFNVRLNPAAYSHLAAASWTDGTALVRGVGAREWPLLHALIHAFEDGTGVPALLSSEFIPAAGQGSLDELIGSVLFGGFDRLIVHDLLITRRFNTPLSDIIRKLVPLLANGQRLALQASDRHTIEAIVTTEFSESAIAISRQAYRVLGFTERLPLQECCRRLGMCETESVALAEELLDLWYMGRIKFSAE